LSEMCLREYTFQTKHECPPLSENIWWGIFVFRTHTSKKRTNWTNWTFISIWI